jgi:hypothetical protein
MTDRLGLILAPGPDGRCDDYRVGGAIVDHDPVDALWRMWYYCRDRDFAGPPTLGTGRIAMATSRDGIVWTRLTGPLDKGAVLVPSGNLDDFDSLHIGLTDVTRGAGCWLMWYFGGDHSLRTCLAPQVGTEAGLGMRAGLARSIDGVRWERVRGPHSSGAFFDFQPDQLYASWPNLLWDGRQYIMQYTAPTLDLSDFRTMVATSTNGLDWHQHGALVWADGSRAYEEGGIVTRQMLQNPLPGGRRYLMIYTATDARHGRSVAAADSDDGIAWHHLYDEPIFHVGAPGAWDDYGVAANRIVAVGDQFYFYYYGFQTLGADDGLRGIGLATCPISDLRALKRHEG